MLNKFLHSEENLLIHIIVQDEDGPNNNILYRSCWMLKFLLSPTVNCPSRETEETSTPNKTCYKCDNDETPTGKKNTTIEWEDGEKGNK